MSALRRLQTAYSRAWSTDAPFRVRFGWFLLLPGAGYYAWGVALANGPLVWRLSPGPSLLFVFFFSLFVHLLSKQNRLVKLAKFVDRFLGGAQKPPGGT